MVASTILEGKTRKREIKHCTKLLLQEDVYMVPKHGLRQRKGGIQLQQHKCNI
jgi:hypothetical protein